MSRFAEGPWKIAHSELNGYRVNDQSGWGVAVILKDTNDKENAYLIAAAPTMLELLERTIARLEQWDRDNICNDDDLYTDLINTVAEIKEKERRSMARAKTVAI